MKHPSLRLAIECARGRRFAARAAILGALAGAFLGVVGCRSGDETSHAGAGASSSSAGPGGAGGAGQGGATSASGGASMSGGGGAGGSVDLPHCEATDPRATPADVWAEPDAGEAPYVASLEKATQKIRVMVYLMGYGQILDTLKAKAMAGVTVQVILDQANMGINQKYFDQLTAAGAEVHWSDPAFSYMHAKSFVVDDLEAVISTGNYLVTNIMQERNFVARDADRDDVAALTALFDADWDQSSPDLSCTRLVVSPVNSRDRILSLIASATSTLDIESMEFSDGDVRDAVVARAGAGVTVRVLLADPSWIDSNADGAAFLAQHGVVAHRLATPRLHVKAIGVDGERAYIGSENFSYTSLDLNREVGLVVTEAAGVGTVHDAFETDWAASSTF